MHRKFPALILIACLAMTSRHCQAARTETASLQNRPAEALLAKLSPSARQLAEQLKVADFVDEINRKQLQYTREPGPTLLLEITMLRQKVLMSMQHAAFEVEEALAAIDGDLAHANMQLAYISARRERSLLLNNVSTFVGAGTLGLLDSATSIRLGTPTSQIFGILSNSVSAGLPLLALRRLKYAPPAEGHVQINVLAPIFDRPYPGVAYDPIVWTYLNSIPPEANNKMTRLEQLRNNWGLYRSISTGGDTRSRDTIDALVGITRPNEKVSPDLLKTRYELLFDVRALVQHMYKDISELNSALLRSEL